MDSSLVLHRRDYRITIDIIPISSICCSWVVFCYRLLLIRPMFMCYVECAIGKERAKATIPGYGHVQMSNVLYLELLGKETLLLTALM
jgi:hypothetical protein